MQFVTEGTRENQYNENQDSLAHFGQWTHQAVGDGGAAATVGGGVADAVGDVTGWW